MRVPPLYLRALVGSFLVCCSAPIAPAFTLRVDFDSGSPTQSGWQSLAGNDSALGDSWSKNLTGGYSIDVDAIGGVTLDSRDRGSGNGGGPESNMWRDFLFANGSNASAPGTGLRISITGLAANTAYPVTIWAFDDSSNDGRDADWSGGGAGPATLSFPTAPDPSSLDDYRVVLEVTADASGDLVLSGLVAALNPDPSHNVFINGLEVGDPGAPPTAPTDLALSNQVVASTASIGTGVGTFSTTDPTPGDSFTYSLVGGVGSTHNGRFVIDGDQLQTDRDLSDNPGGAVLSVRVRTTDADGDWFEKVFLLEVVNDSDGDGLDDAWELGFFPNLMVASGAGNNDPDALTNLEEQAAGTNPTLADSDGDGLDDAAEINVHATNPIVADSDGDSLSDGDEVSGVNGYVTDPTKADSDDDGFNDALEIAEGTDPGNGGDFPNTLLPLRLNEILARNSTGISDGDGRREDWIEIYNPNAVAVNLDGYYLTDDEFLLTQWNFPAVTIAANGYLIVFVSGTDRVDGGGNPHTNFQLSAAGEFLAIVRPNGTTIDDSFSPSYPEQFTDISYGIPTTGGDPVFYQSSTPGAVNSASAYPGVVKDTNFSIDRGFYDAPFQVAITSGTPGAIIRYTTDGSKPSPSSGTVYSGPVDITTTTNLRAIAYFGGWLPTNVDSHTYIFLDDVVRQPTDPPGWPSTWGTISQGTVPSDYEMDPRVVDDVLGIAEHTVSDALLDIPTVSISMPQSDVTGGSNGIYTNPGSRIERECSIEYIRPDGTPGFQEDCLIVPHGNSSRNPYRMQKHSLRLIFTSEVGTSKLRYPLFPDSDIEEFNKLVLRACFTDSWALASWSSGRYRPNDSQYIRDVWMKDSLGAMGQPSSHGNFVHLYVNGLYFGMHNLTERIEDDWYADHIGGEKEDWIINKDLSEQPSRWRDMMGILNGSITSNATYEAAKDYIDVENYADYMLLHFYADSEDWPHHNGYAAANADSGDGRFRFFVWDQEIALDKFSWNRYADGRGGGAPFQRLRLNEEFRTLFADRVHKHLFNGGALSEQSSIARYMGLADRIDKAIVAESARWGDVQETTPYGNTPSSSNNVDADYYPPLINNPIYFTREQHWLVERDNVVGHYIPTLHDESDSRAIINELRSNNLFPSIDPPLFSQHGGPVPNNYFLAISAGEGDIYFTTDGSDPRMAGGGINPAATMLNGGTIVDGLIGFEEAGWRFLDTGAAQSDSDVVVGHASYGAGDWKHPAFNDASWGTGQAMLGYGGITGGTINTPIEYGPSSTSKYVTSYFRKDFNVSGASDYTDLSIGIKRDDGAIVYLNGREIARSGMDAGVVFGFADVSSTSAGGSAESAVNSSSFALSPGMLVEGVNVLAVEVHQATLGSSDLGIDVELSGSKPNGGGATGATLTQTGRVMARALSDGEWSAVTDASFIVGILASSANLVVSEVYYNPPGSLEETEFVELMNTSSSETIDLTGVSLTGVSYTFPEGFTLAPLQRVVIVKDQVAFAAAYNTAGILIAPGDFGSTNLANGGEEIAVIAQDGVSDIQRFTYDDELPWPVAADGPGSSLVLIAPETNPDHSLPSSWRASSAAGGSPGAGDGGGFSGDPDADLDGDSISAWVEYALGTSDLVSSAQALPVASISSDGGDAYLTLSFQRNLDATDVRYSVEVGSDLAGWSDDTIFVSTTDNGNGTATDVYRSNTPIGAEDRQFIRLRVSAR